MKKIALISDTHSYIGKDTLKYIKDVDEIWHAGDIGSMEVLAFLENLNIPLRIVWGNIDDVEMQDRTEYDIYFICEGVRVYMIHIGGYPKRYYKKVRKKLNELKPDLYICGHSHILKVMRDQELGLLHFNPGAVGKTGFNKFRTMLIFECHEGKISNLKAVELGLRAEIEPENRLLISKNTNKA